MQINISLECHTTYGQNVSVIIDNQYYPMQYVSDSIWFIQVSVNSVNDKTYRYVVKQKNTEDLMEWPRERSLPKITGKATLSVFDEFNYGNDLYVFQTKPFTDCLLRRNKIFAQPRLTGGKCLIRAIVPEIEPYQEVAILGAHPMLGAWNPEKRLSLKPNKNGAWSVLQQFSVDAYGTEYKLIIFDTRTGQIADWEDGKNRLLPNIRETSVITLQMRKQPQWKGAGVAIPVFSLRSETDWGIGEFFDLLEFSAWAKQTGQKIIQILPVNDTTSTFSNTDSYPYRANSVNALHPLYLNMEAVGVLNDEKQMDQFRLQAKKLNESPFVDYANVLKLKLKYLKLIFEETGQKVFATKKYQRFFDANRHWLLPYAVYSCLRDEFCTADFKLWGKWSDYNSKLVEDYALKNQNAVAFYYFVQYHTAKQLAETHAKINANGVVLKGDLPIGISSNSVDAWMYPDLFHLDKQAGAPPDDFSITGQNWSFPTYNWQNMAKSDYRWWKNRFEVMNYYFDAFRIDHILGFFRIWEVPQNAVWGLLGTFNPAMPLTQSEIRRYGIPFEAERFLKPYITDEFIEKKCGDAAGNIKLKFFNRLTDTRLEFRPEFDSQKKLQAYFDNQGLLPKQQALFDALMEMFAEVLLIEDSYRHGTYHPRILLCKSYSYACLDASLKTAFKRLHEDFYYHRHDVFWQQSAMQKLPMLLESNKMMVCGEDLGMVPSCVPFVMKNIEILSLEIQRMPKKTNTEFVSPDDVPYLSVCSTGTHDMSPIRSWWHENVAATQRFYNHMLHLSGKAPAVCNADIAQRIISQELMSNGMWVIFPLQDELAIDDALKFPDADGERINVPDNPNQFWSYRIHLNISTLKSSEQFNQTFSGMIKASGR